MKNDPVFVSGCPKSGTTLVARLLSNIPNYQLDYDLAVAWEFLRDYERNMASPIVQGEFEKDPLNEHAKSLFETGRYDELSREFFGQLHSGYDSGKVWGNSAKPCIFYKETLRRWYPQGDFVLVLRNPLDVWASLKLANWSGQPWADTLEGFCSTYMKFFAHTADPKVLIVKYEDVVVDPMAAYKHFSDLPEGYLRGTGEVFAHRTLPKFPDPDGISRSDGIRTDRVGRWKEELFPYEELVIRELLAQVLEEFYYS